MVGFERALGAQRERSRAAGERTVGDWTVVAEGQPSFVGYDSLERDTAYPSVPHPHR